MVHDALKTVCSLKQRRKGPGWLVSPLLVGSTGNIAPNGADELRKDATGRLLTADGNLRANPQVQQWLQTLPPDEQDALLRFYDNGSTGRSLDRIKNQESTDARIGRRGHAPVRLAPVERHRGKRHRRARETTICCGAPFSFGCLLRACR